MQSREGVKTDMTRDLDLKLPESLLSHYGQISALDSITLKTSEPADTVHVVPNRRALAL